MYRVFCILAVVLLVCSWAYAKEPKGNRMLFIIEPDREKDTLKADAELVYQAVIEAKEGDFIDVMALDTTKVFSLRIERKNPLEQKRDKNLALVRLVAYVTKEPEFKKHKTVNIAAALKLALGRFNVERTYDRYVLVMFSGGLQNDGSVDFTRGYPSDSWIAHRNSPFSIIPMNTTGRTVEVLFVPRLQDYGNSIHRQRMERFYALLMNSRKVRLTGFTEDHYTISELVRHGSQEQPKYYQPVDVNGKLILYRIDGKEQYFEKVEQKEDNVDIQEEDTAIDAQEETSSVESVPLPGHVTGSVLKFSIDEGVASLWVSVRDPQDNPVENLQKGNFEIYETVDSSSRRMIPAEKLTIGSKKPLAVVILRDVSPSQDKPALRDSEDAIKTFLDLMVQQDAVSLINFSWQSSTVKKFTTDKVAVKRAIKVPLLRFGTAFYDALLYSLEQLEKQKGDYLRAVVAFTDGDDNASKHTPEDVYNAAQRMSVPLFLIGIGFPHGGTLSSLAKSTGGMYFSTSSTSGLKQIYQQLSEVLNNSIILSYPTSAVSGNVKVDIAVKEGINSQSVKIASGAVKL